MAKNLPPTRDSDFLGQFLHRGGGGPGLKDEFIALYIGRGRKGSTPWGTEKTGGFNGRVNLTMFCWEPLNLRSRSNIDGLSWPFEMYAVSSLDDVCACRKFPKICQKLIYNEFHIHLLIEIQIYFEQSNFLGKDRNFEHISDKRWNHQVFLWFFNFKQQYKNKKQIFIKMLFYLVRLEPSN